jgi:Rod binding domain-containing protein
MDISIAKPILTEPVPQPNRLIEPDEIDTVGEEEKKQTAKDFEAVFINKLLDEMKIDTQNWGFEENNTQEQIRGIFNLYLSGHIANNGGFGLWKDIYKSLTNSAQTNTKAEQPDKNI